MFDHQKIRTETSETNAATIGGVTIGDFHQKWGCVLIYDDRIGETKIVNPSSDLNTFFLDKPI